MICDKKMFSHAKSCISELGHIRLLTDYTMFHLFVFWQSFLLAHSAPETTAQTVEDLETRCKDAGIEIVTRQSFLSDPTDAVRNLRRQDARIIVGLFYVVAARRVLCEMYKQQLYGRAYVWFFIGKCTEKSLLIFSPQPSPPELLSYAPFDQQLFTRNFLLWGNEQAKSVINDADDRIREYPSMESIPFSLHAPKRWAAGKA